MKSVSEIRLEWKYYSDQILQLVYYCVVIDYITTLNVMLIHVHLSLNTILKLASVEFHKSVITKHIVHDNT